MEAARRHKGLLMLALLAGTAAAALLSLCVGSVSLSLAAWPSQEAMVP